MNNYLNGFVNSTTDEELLKSLPTGEDCTEELEKAMNKAGLTQKEVQVQGKNGIYTKKVWVRTGEETKKEQNNSNKGEDSEKGEKGEQKDSDNNNLQTPSLKRIQSEFNKAYGNKKLRVTNTDEISGTLADGKKVKGFTVDVTLDGENGTTYMICPNEKGYTVYQTCDEYDIEEFTSDDGIHCKNLQNAIESAAESWS